MKKFIKNIILFLLCIIIFLIVFDRVISSLLRKSDKVERNIVWKEIFTGKLQNDMIIMGSSRAEVQYSPVILDSLLKTNSYNLGMSGRGIMSQILRYNTYRRLDGKPKLIIQNIDLMTIERDNGFCREQFFPYFYDKTFGQEVVKLENLTLADKYIPGYRYAGYFPKILSWLGIVNRESYTLTKGYSGVDLKWNGSKLKKLTQINYEHDSLALRLFDQYLAKAHSENIRIIFVYAPLYISATEKIRNIKGMYQMYDTIAQKYNIPILDYTYDPICYDTAYFYNATHLNKKGSELFSAKLAHALDSLKIFTH